jgi:hypothetical protein
MAKEKKSTTNVQGLSVSIIMQRQDDYFLYQTLPATEMPSGVTIFSKNWLSNRSTI